MRSRIIVGLTLTALCPALSGCVSGAAQQTLRALETAQRSRVAYLVRYDKDYADELERWVANLRTEQADPATSDPISLAFALDELADVHAFRMVHFEKAYAVNSEAKELLHRIERDGRSGKLGWYFSHRRRLYPFVIGPGIHLVGAIGRPTREDRDPIDSGLVWARAGREPIMTVYPPSFIARVADYDTARLKERVESREKTLRQLMGLEEAAATDETGAERKPAEHFSALELSALESVLSGVDEYEQSLLVLDRVWSLQADMGRESWLRAVAAAGEKALAAEALRGRDKDAYRAAVTRFRLGIVRVWLGRHGQGIAMFEEMLRLVDDYDRHQQELYQKARSGLRTERFVQVLGHLAFGSVLALFVETQYRKKLSWLEAQYGPGKHGLSAFLDEHERAAFHFELGRAYEVTGQTPKAIDQYKQAIEIIERQRATIRTEAGRIAYVRDREAPYTRLVPLLVRAGELRGAFEYAERARSRAFLDLLGTGRVRFGASDEAALYERIVRRQAEIDTLVEAGLPRPVAREAYAAVRDIKVTADVQAPVSLEFEALTAVQTANLEEISAALGRETALVTFFVGEEETVVLLLQDGSVSGWTRPLGRGALVSRVRQIRRALEAPAAGAANGSTEEVNALGRALYQELLAPAFATLKKRVVYMVPHGPLHYVPFAAIHDGRGYLLDHYTLLTVSSGTVLTHLQRKQLTPRGPTVVLANPDLGDRRLDLLHADREGRAIQGRRSDAVLLTRQMATEAKARELAPTAAVFHLAAHATLDVRRPLESAVLLAPGDGQDGRLTAGEVFGLKLPASLVVLSACQTGLGPVASGDELIGLTRAFMYAGAPHVIATLWSISDESTATLMDEFYDRLGKVPVSEALRLAQMSVRSRYPHPFYWAAFSVFGHYR